VAQDRHMQGVVMQGVIVSILTKILINMATYELVARVIVELLQYAAKHTENNVDDAIVEAVRKALLKEPEQTPP
jgi:hypothetical protein